MSNRVLKPSDHINGGTIYLITDASNTGTSGWMGKREDGVISPAAFHSRTLNNSQVNYTTTDKQLFAIYDSLKHSRGELQGHEFVIRTDHKPLLTFMSHILESQMKRRWQNTMSEFNFTVEHIKGSDNVLADVLRKTTYNEPSSPSEGT